MRKSAIGAFVGILALGFLTSNSVLAAEGEMTVPMGEITMESMAKEPQRPPVNFPHAVHFTYNCHQCHHKWDNTKPIAGCTASGCHDLAEPARNENGTPVRDKLVAARYYKNAYHGLCIGCHQEIKRKAKAIENSNLPVGQKVPSAGPTGCSECHQKE